MRLGGIGAEFMGAFNRELMGTIFNKQPMYAFVRRYIVLTQINGCVRFHYGESTLLPTLPSRPSTNNA